MAADRLRDGDANCVQGKGGRASKAQAALAKIIEVISTIPPPPSFPPVESKTKAPIVADDAELKLAMERDGIINGGTNNSSASLVIDPIDRDDDVAMEDDDGDLISPLPGDAPRKHQNNSEGGECNRKEDEKKGNGEISGGEEEEEMNPDQGGCCKGGSTPSARKEENNNNNNNNDDKGSKEGYLDLLLEAVQHELPRDQDEEEEEQGKGVQECSEEVNKDTDKERVGHQSCWSQKLHLYSEESAAPVARSKRGIRKQTLPSRYRDSVLQPWAKPPTLHRHR